MPVRPKQLSKKETESLYQEFIKAASIPAFVEEKLEDNEVRFALLQRLFDEWEKTKDSTLKQGISTRMQILSESIARDFEPGMSSRTAVEKRRGILIDGNIELFQNDDPKESPEEYIVTLKNGKQIETQTFDIEVPNPLILRISKAQFQDMKKMAECIRHCAEFGIPFEVDSNFPQMTLKEQELLKRELNNPPQIWVNINDYFPNSANHMIHELRNLGVEYIYYQRERITKETFIPEVLIHREEGQKRPAGRKELQTDLRKQSQDLDKKEGGYFSKFIKRKRASEPTSEPQERPPPKRRKLFSSKR